LTSKEFITKTVKQITNEGIPVFPDAFLPQCETVPFKLPSRTLILGNEFFGLREVLTSDGSLFCHSESLSRARYLVYASGIKDREVKIPINESDIEIAVKNYGKFLDSVLRKTEKEYRSLFPESKDANSVINEVFRILNLKRL
jgi:hypothetical protein